MLKTVIGYKRTEYVNDEGDLHREDGPAIVYDDSTAENAHEEYWLNGELHRVGGPAIIKGRNKKGEVLEEWYQNGMLHRTEGPAINYPNCKMWYANGKKHRADGPAVEIETLIGNVEIEWWVNGKLHREDGPAVSNKYYDEYCIDGKPTMRVYKDAAAGRYFGNNAG